VDILATATTPELIYSLQELFRWGRVGRKGQGSSLSKKLIDVHIIVHHKWHFSPSLVSGS
jgi:hypothetical protein